MNTLLPNVFPMGAGICEGVSDLQHNWFVKLGHDALQTNRPARRRRRPIGTLHSRVTTAVCKQATVSKLK